MEHKGMNEQIKEFALQSGAGEWGDSVVPAMMDIEKFAELIVQECIEKVNETMMFTWPEMQVKIKEHFGIE